MEVLELKQKNVEERSNTVDVLKGILIILVVLGHTYNKFTTDFVYLFHVGMFFILSGYCFSQKYTETISSLKTLFIKRIKSLWIPYVAYNFVFLVLQNFLIKINLITDNNDYFLFNPLHSGGFVSRITLISFIKTFIKSFFFINARPLCGGLWFLGCLFYVTLVYSFIQFILNKLKCSKIHIVISLLMIIIAWIIERQGFVKTFPFLKFLILIFFTEVLFTLGTYIKVFDFSFVHTYFSKAALFVITVIFFSIVFYLSKYATISIASLNIVNPLFFITCTLCGGGLLLNIVYLLNNRSTLMKGLSFIGKKTLPILALHLLCFKIITLIQVLIYNGAYLQLAMYPVWKTSILWSLLYVIVGVGVPLIIVKFFGRIKLLNIIFKL